MQINIGSNITEFIKGLNDFEKKQLPYASSVALNNAAEIAMKNVSKSIDKNFDITSSWNKVGGKFGVKKNRASKKNLEVEIFIPKSNTWITDHEDGEERTTQLIPTNAFKKLFPTLKTNRSIKRKAKTLLSNKSKNRIFEAPLTTGFGNKRQEGSKHGTRAIFQRVKGKTDGSRRLRSKKSGRLLKAKKVFNRDAIPLFIIKDLVKENPILGFEKTIKNTFDKDFNNEFSKAFNYAMSTK